MALICNITRTDLIFNCGTCLCEEKWVKKIILFSSLNGRSGFLARNPI